MATFLVLQTLLQSSRDRQKTPTFLMSWMIPSAWCRLGIVRDGILDGDVLDVETDGDVLEVDEVYGRGHGYGGRPKPPVGLGLRFVFAVT